MLEANGEDELDLQLRELLEVLPESDAWRLLLRGNHADIYCTVDVECDVSGLAIHHEVLSELGRRNLDLSVEMYVAETTQSAEEAC